ncbi:MAG: BON domain-containing protein, partial [Planctomycetota bacterium]
TGDQAAGGTGAAAGATGDSLFQPEEVESSAFSQIERGSSIGSSSTQGFGVVAESGGTGGFGGGSSFFGGGGGGGLGGLGGLFGGFGNAFGGQGAQSTRPTLRVRLKSAIQMAPPTAAQRQQSARRALARVPSTIQLRGVRVAMDGQTAVLSGSVQSSRERRMAELLMKLEPGVRGVDNQLSVSGQ